MNPLEMEIPKKSDDAHEILTVVLLLSLPCVFMSVGLGLVFGTVGYMSGGIFGLTAGAIAVKVR